MNHRTWVPLCVFVGMGATVVVIALVLLGRITLGVTVAATGACVLAGGVAHAVSRGRMPAGMRVLLDRSVISCVLAWAAAAVHIGRSAIPYRALWTAVLVSSAVPLLGSLVMALATRRYWSGAVATAPAVRSDHGRRRLAGVALLVGAIILPMQLPALLAALAGMLLTVRKLPWEKDAAGAEPGPVE